MEGLLRVQRSIAETLEIYGKLYDRQVEQLQKLQADVARVHDLVYKLYVINYPPTPASSMSKMTAQHMIEGF